MYLEKYKKQIKDIKERQKKNLCNEYKAIEVMEKINPVITKWDATMSNSTYYIGIYYNLKKDEPVSGIPWQIIEEIDEALNDKLRDFNVENRPEYQSNRISAKLENGVMVNLDVYYGASEKCKIVKTTETVIKEVNTLICEE